MYFWHICGRRWAPRPSFFFNFIYLFIFGCVGSSFLREGFLQLRRRGGHSSSRGVGLSLSRPLLWRSTGSRHAGSVTVAHGPSCPAACGILPDQGSNPRPLHWQADSQPLRHQGSPTTSFCSAILMSPPVYFCLMSSQFNSRDLLYSVG